jgi:filamin
MFSLLSDKGTPVPYKLVNNNDRTYRAEFEANIVGTFTANVFFVGRPVPKSPFKITIESGSDSSKVKVYGPAIEQPVLANHATYLIVDCKEAGQGIPMANLLNDKGAQVPYKLVDNGDKTYRVEFEATVAGVHTLNVFFANKPVPKSPFKINVGTSTDVSKITVNGLPETVPVNKETPFEVNTAGAGAGPVKAIISAPSGRTFPGMVQQRPDGATARFTPTEPGPHSVQVTFNDVPVPNSPFRVIAQAPNPFKVKVYGPALEKPIVPYQPTYLIVDCKEAGPGEPIVTLLDDKGAPVPVHVLDNKDKTYRIEFSSVAAGTIVANVMFANQPVPNSPFKISSVQSEVKVYGPALEKPVQPNQPTFLTVDCKNAGPGQPQVHLTTDNGAPVPAHVTDNGNHTYRVDFQPTITSGTVAAAVTFNNQPVPNSPFKITVEATDDASKVVVKDLPTSVPIGRIVPFDVVTAGAGPGQVKVNLVSPSGKITSSPVELKPDGVVGKITATELGPHDVHVLFNDKPVPHSPFRVTSVNDGAPVQDGGDASKVLSSLT